MSQRTPKITTSDFKKKLNLVILSKPDPSHSYHNLFFFFFESRLQENSNDKKDKKTHAFANRGYHQRLFPPMAQQIPPLPPLPFPNRFPEKKIKFTENITRNSHIFLSLTHLWAYSRPRRSMSSSYRPATRHTSPVPGSSLGAAC